MRQKRSQLHNSCGIVALSMLTNKPFYEVLKLTHPHWKPGRNIRGTTHTQLIRALKKLGIKYKIHAAGLTYSGIPKIDKRIKIHKFKNNLYIGLYMPDGGRHAIVWSAKDRKIMHCGYTKLDVRYVNKNKYRVIEILDKQC